jgi:hypothetical protein
MVCPIPAPGEWLQRRAIVQHHLGRLHTLRRRWQRRMHNIWLQNFCFLAMAIFSTVRIGVKNLIFLPGF